MRTLLALWAAIFIAAHLPFLPSTLGDLDAIDLAFAVRDFDVTRNQPPPPGSPLHVGTAKLATAALHALGDPANAPHALAGLSLVGAALALIAIYAFARVLGSSTRRAFAASLVAGSVPLYWLTASRPLGDFPGLAAALAAQALLARAMLAGGPRYAAAGAALAGAAIGFSPRTIVLTLPLLAAVLLSRRLSPRARLWAGAAAVAGALAWVVPLVVDTGAAAYAAALTDRWREQLAGASMLLASPSRHALGQALYATFVDPFGGVVLASLVLGIAAIGLAVAIVRERPVLKVLALGFLPYALLHVLAQDTRVSHLALPLIPAMALLFVLPLEYISRQSVLPVAAGAATAGLIVAVPALAAYVQAESPAFAVIRDLHRLPRIDDTVLGMHRRIASDLARHQAWTPIPPMRTLPSPVDYEWLELVQLWREGYEGAIWFLADPRRTDLRMIDPRQRRLLGRYEWPASTRPFVGGIRPERIDWYVIDRPGWFLGRGWALSPEIGGLTARDRESAGAEPAVAWVRRRPSALAMLLGGWHLGDERDPPIVLRVRVDGTQIDEWPIRPGPFVFMRPVLPEEMAGASTYARMEVDASWEGGGAPPMSLEQYDLQAIDGAMVAYDEGWWEPEYDARSGRTWRWTSGEATLWLYHPGRDLTLAISGEDPTRHYGRGTVMTVLAGERELGRFTLDDHFTHTLTIPAGPLSVSRGRVTLRVSNTHVPGPLTVRRDDRELGIRIYDVAVY